MEFLVLMSGVRVDSDKLNQGGLCGRLSMRAAFAAEVMHFARWL